MGEVLASHPHVFVATDDMYEHILWGHEFATILNTSPSLYERTIVLNGVSKAYAMTGWRIGYAAGPESLIKAMKKIQSQSTSNACSIAQHAAVDALNGQLPVKEMVDAFKIRHDYVFDRLQKIDGVKVIPADGTFYIFPNVQEIINRKGYKDDIEFAEHLLNDAGVALVPGSAFGAPGCIRLSFATSQSILEDALNRIESFAKSHYAPA